MKWSGINLSSQQAYIMIAWMIVTPLILFVVIAMRWQLIQQHQQLTMLAKQQQLTSLTEFASALITTQFSQENNDGVDEILIELNNNEFITEVYLTNEFAGIISPKNRVLEVVDDIRIEQVIEDTINQTVVDTSDHEVNIYRAIYLNGELEGILKINYRHEYDKMAIFEFWTVMVLFILAVLTLLLIYLIQRIWLSPWDRLHEQISAAVDLGVTVVPTDDFPEPLKKHWVLYSRLLVKTKHLKNVDHS